MDEENQINDKLKIMKFSLLPCGLEHTQFFSTTKAEPLIFVLLLHNLFHYYKCIEISLNICNGVEHKCN